MSDEAVRCRGKSSAVVSLSLSDRNSAVMS